jgi:hypothetical protein
MKSNLLEVESKHHIKRKYNILPLGKKKLLEVETMWNVRLYNKKG